MNVSQEGVAITNRFFEAIDTLKAQRKLRGLQTFTRKYGINRWNMLTVKRNPERCVLKVEWLAILAKDYGVSVDWLVLGTGDMFK